MAVTELVLVWLGSMAVLANAAMFLRLDRTTNMIIPFVAAFLWGVVAISSFDVIVTDSDPLQSVSMTPVVYLSIAFSMTSALFGVYEFISGSAKDVEESLEETTLFD